MYNLFNRFLVGVISFPTFYFVKEWLLKQKKIHNEERRKIIKELRMKQQDEYEEMLRREKEQASSWCNSYLISIRRCWKWQKH